MLVDNIFHLRLWSEIFSASSLSIAIIPPAVASCANKNCSAVIKGLLMPCDLFWFWYSLPPTPSPHTIAVWNTVYSPDNKPVPFLHKLTCVSCYVLACASFFGLCPWNRRKCLFFLFFFCFSLLKILLVFFLYLFLKHCHNLLNASHSRKACWSMCCHFLFPGGCEISDEFLHSLDLGSPKFPLTAFGELKLPALFFQMLLLLLTVLCESLLKINISQI